MVQAENIDKGKGKDINVDKVFNRLRARLFNMLEQMNLDETQLEACKKTVRSITSSAWNDLSNN